MRSEMFMTTFMSCSMSRMVMPSSSRMRRKSIRASSLSAGFMPAAGSSSSSSRGSVARARAISSRRCAP